MYFTRWIEMVHPVPGGPTFPEQKKRGHKKNVDIIVGDIAVKADQPLKDMNMEIDNGDILEFEKNRDKIKGKNKVKIKIKDKDKDKDKDKERAKDKIKDKDKDKDKIKDKDKDKNGLSHSSTHKDGPRSKSLDGEKVEVGEKRRRCLSADKTHPLRRRRRKTCDSLASLPMKASDKRATRSPSSSNIDTKRNSRKDLDSCDLQGIDYTDGLTPFPSTAVSENAQGPYSVLTGGCTAHVAGEGAIQTRFVDLNARLFQRESKCREVRKAILREELRLLTECLQSLGEKAEERTDSCKVNGIPLGGANKKTRAPNIGRDVSNDPSDSSTVSLPALIPQHQDQRQHQHQNEHEKNEKNEKNVPRRKTLLGVKPSTLFKTISQTASAHFPPKFQRSFVLPPTSTPVTHSEAVSLPTEAISSLSSNQAHDDTDTSSNNERDDDMKGDDDQVEEGSEQDTRIIHNCSDENTLIPNALEGQETDDEEDCEIHAMRTTDDEQEGSAQETDDELPERKTVRESVNAYDADDAEETEDEVNYKKPIVRDERIESDDTDDDDSRNNGQYGVQGRNNEVQRSSLGSTGMNIEDNEDQEEEVEEEEEDRDEDDENTDDAMEVEGDVETEDDIDDEAVSDDTEVRPAHTQTSRAREGVAHRRGLEDEEDYASECAVIEEDSLDVAFKSRNYDDQIYRVGGLDAVNVEEEEEEEGDGSEEGRDLSDEESLVARGFSSDEDDDDSVQSADSHRY
jgi:hypothetical protein